MEIIDFELRRYDQWKADLESCRKQCETPQTPDMTKSETPATHRSAESRK